MKLLVDELPLYSDTCPFFTYDGSNGCKLDPFEEYECHDPEKCPYLKVMEEKKKNDQQKDQS